MALQVVQVPDPAVGADWSTVVPGINLWDVTGITAELAAGGGPGTFPNCLDVSGNGNDALYTDSGSTFVPGLVPGNGAIQRNAGNGDQINSYQPIVDLSVPFTYTEWIELAALPPDDLQLGAFSTGVLHHTGWNLLIPIGFQHRFFLIGSKDPAGNATIFKTANNTVPYDGLPHMIAVTFDPAANPQNNFYLDGVLLPWNVTDVPFFNNGASNGWSFNIGFSPLVTDEIAIVPGALTAGQVAALYAAGGAFAGYNAAVMALTPFVYYHLDNGIAVGGREPSLVVSNGTNDVIVIPPGFPAVATPGPFTYAWQPNLNADSQSTDGTLTTVAIPRLLVPAGYVVEARTPDIQAADQWSGVTVWWDDSYQNLTNPLTAYNYPPGAFLQYQQIGQ